MDRNNRTLNFVIGIITVIVIILIVWWILASINWDSLDFWEDENVDNDDVGANTEIVVTDFASCADAGGSVTGAIPLQCEFDGEVFNQNLDESGSRQVSLYFTSPELLAEDCGGTVAVVRDIPVRNNVYESALREQFKGPGGTMEELGLITSFEGWGEVLEEVNFQNETTAVVNFAP